MNVMHTPLFFDVFRYRPTEGMEDFRGEAWHRDASGYARVHEVRLAAGKASDGTSAQRAIAGDVKRAKASIGSCDVAAMLRVSSLVRGSADVTKRTARPHDRSDAPRLNMLSGFGFNRSIDPLRRRDRRASPQRATTNDVCMPIS
jgi:hypothetical protein